jgi:hypothetical protein
MDEPLGAKFWLGLVGACAGVAIAAGVIFVIFGAAWYAWGAVGAMIVVVGMVVLGVSLANKISERRRGDLQS